MTACRVSIRIRYRRHDSSVFLYAFDLIELNGDDLRRDPLEVRKATLASVLARADRGIWLNDHIQDDGPTVFKHACKLGLEGIVSDWEDDSRYEHEPGLDIRLDGEHPTIAIRDV
jgi:ATP-dependent DNA ligase